MCQGEFEVGVLCFSVLCRGVPLYHILKQLHGVHDVLVLENQEEKHLSPKV